MSSNGRGGGDDYVVEIRARRSTGGEWSFGTGYVVSKRRILTALHVVIGDDAVESGSKIAEPAILQIRTEGAFKRKFAPIQLAAEAKKVTLFDQLAADDDLWRDAALRWPVVGASASDMDVAVLEFRDSRDLDFVDRTDGCVVGALNGTTECRLFGYPTWTAFRDKAGRTIADGLEAIADCSGAASRTRMVRSMSVRASTPPQNEEWRGLSGAALFDRSQRLVGVTITAKRTSDNSGLGFIAIEALCRTDFEGFWTAAQLSRPKFIDPEATDGDPCEYIYLFDRSTEESIVGDRLDWSYGSKVSPPVVTPILGFVPDDCAEFVNRLCKQVFDGAKNRTLTAMLDRPAAATMRELIRKVTGVRETGVPSDEKLDVLGNRLAGESVALGLPADKIETSLEWLRDWLTLWSKLGARPQPPILHLLSYAEYNDGGEQLLSSAKARLAEELAEFEDVLTVTEPIVLGKCELTHIGEWQSALIDLGLGPAFDNAVERWHAILTNHITDVRFHFDRVRRAFTAA